jgi:predicted Ser/Thr protein kinase
MKNNILKSSFKNINTDEVKTFLKNQTVDVSKSFNRMTKQSAPELYFYDENEIEAGYYDFEIDGLSFQKCWIESFDKIENEPIRYRGGSYYVFTTT